MTRGRGARHLGHRGSSGSGVFPCLLFLGVLIYATFLFGEPHYNHYALKGRADEMIALDFKSEKDLRDQFMAEAYRLGVNLDPEALRVEVRPGMLPLIATSWSVDVSAFGYYITTYKFDIRVGGTYSKY